MLKVYVCSKYKGKVISDVRGSRIRGFVGFEGDYFSLLNVSYFTSVSYKSDVVDIRHLVP